MHPSLNQLILSLSKETSRSLKIDNLLSEIEKDKSGCLMNDFLNALENSTANSQLADIIKQQPSSDTCGKYTFVK